MSERAIQNGYLIAAQNDIEKLRARIAALEEVVRAADRMRAEASAVLSTDRADPTDGNRYSIHGDRLLDLNGTMNVYDSKRAALGEIGGE